MYSSCTGAYTRPGVYTTPSAQEHFPGAQRRAAATRPGTCIYRGTQIGCNRAATRIGRLAGARNMQVAVAARREIRSVGPPRSPHVPRRIIIIVNCRTRAVRRRTSRVGDDDGTASLFARLWNRAAVGIIYAISDKVRLYVGVVKEILHLSNVSGIILITALGTHAFSPTYTSHVACVLNHRLH